MSHCVRSITFTIPGSLTSPDVQVYVEELNGKLVFTASVIESGGKTADLRGLFFNLNDDSKLAGLTHSGSGGKVTDFDTVNVIDLGQGANMQGVHDPYDVGLEFGREGIGKDDIKTATFTLSNTANNLTLDDIAQVDFGARLTSVGNIGGLRDDGSKLTATAPAAPDAKDDSYSIYEDGQSGLNDPSKVSEGVKFEVLTNDTDADGDTLTITSVEGAQHGTVTIIDGDDADLLVGDAVLYTPNLDYAGTDSFTYCISDGNGGTDYAEVAVNVEAVADVPLLGHEVIAGASVNEFILRVTATQNDADISEFLDHIELSGVPGGVTVTPGGVNPGTEPDQIVQDFTLTLPLNQNVNFDLGISAVSKEVSNGDEQSNSVTVPIVYEYNSTTQNVEFSADDQSIWNTGTEFTFDDNRFLGLNTGNFSERIPDTGGTFFAGIDGHLKLGFESKLHFEGGDIDATANYDVTAETNYNKTTDQLLIDTSALLTAAHFTTDFAEGTYALDFVWDILLDAYAGIDIDFGSIDFDPLGIIPGDQTLDLGGIDETLNLPTVDFGPGSYNLISVDSDTLAGEIPFPDDLGDLFQINYDWPDINAVGNYPPNPVPGTDQSENVLELEIDVDQLAYEVISKVVPLPPVNPLHPLDWEKDVGIGTVFADIDFLDIDAIGGVNIIQDFAMQLGDLTGILVFEDGSSQQFQVGDSLQISNAQAKDDNGLGVIGTANDDIVDFALMVVPTSELQNVTNLGFNIGYDIDLFKVEIGYDVEIFNPFGDNVELGDSFTIGPLAGFDGSTPIGEIEIYDETFALNYAQEQVYFFA